VHLRVSRTDTSHRIEIPGVPTFRVMNEGRGIHCEDRSLSVAADEVITEVFLGPALTLALAEQGVFCLHGSAVRRGERAAAFTGASGSGKSTLARTISSSLDGCWRRVADDITPVEFTRDGVWLHPRFPQLKLEPSDQPWHGSPHPVRLTSLFVLSPKDSHDAQVACSDPLTPARAMAAVAGQTVASRLFEPGLLDAHLQFCRDVAARVPVRVLGYSHRPESIPEVARLLDHHIGPAASL